MSFRPLTSSMKMILIISIMTFILSETVISQKKYSSPKNVIIMIADGWGRNHIDATNYYQYGVNHSQQYEQFPISLYCSTYLGKSINNEPEDWDQGYNSYKAWEDFDYLRHNPTGSAAAATAMSTGKKTYKKSIGMSINGETLFHISERAKEINKAVGVITSVQLSHATPVGFSVHNVHRDNYEEIAQSMILDSKLDVIMGCGHPYYDNDGKQASPDHKFVGGKNLWQQLGKSTIDYTLNDKSKKSVQDIDSDGEADPWTLIESKEDFEIMTTGDTPKRIIGVPQTRKTLQQERSGNTKADAFAVAFNENVPDLPTMTKAAINVLDNDPDGFFLMIEGGAVDWASHDNQTGRMIEEMIDFNNAVDTVIEWVVSNSSWDQTLLIVTSDHECGYLCGPDSDPEHKPIINKGKAEMPVAEWHHDGHTNQLVPLFAKGMGSELFHLFADETDMKRGQYINNTEIAQIIFLLWLIE